MKTVAILLAMVALGANAATRDELKRERNVIEAEHARRAEACKTQFIVTPCLDTVRNDKQKALSHISAQEKALDSVEREARADARKRRLAEKAEGADGAASAVPAGPRASAAAKPPRKPAKARQKPAQPEDRSAREQEKREAFEARQREIEAHRAKVERRNAERARNKPPARPLPPPASAGST